MTAPDKRPASLVLLVLATVGLAVALIAAWPRLDLLTPVEEAEPGSAVTATEAPREQAGSPEAPVSPGGRASVARREAAIGAAGPADGVRPVSVAVGSIRYGAKVRPVGVASDGQMALPPDPRVLGWYRFGPTPGTDDAGSAVLAGHLDTRRFGVGPLVRLRDVEIGDPVEVRTSDGRTTTYEVVQVSRFDQQGLPEELFSRTGPARLQLITCAGEYDADRGGYQQNLVVTAVPG